MSRDHIFISYARKDGSAGAESLEGALAESGFTTWRDTRGIDPTRDFTAEIETAIEAASCVVTCITPDVKRPDSFVRREIGYALATLKPIAVVRFRDVVPPISVVNHTYVDLFPQWNAGIAKLCAILRSPLRLRMPAVPEAMEDPFKDYLEKLYRQIVRYLDRVILSSPTGGGATPLVNVHAEPKSNAVRPQELDALPQAFFDQAGFGDERAGQIYDNVQTAFDQYDGRLLLLGEPGSGKTVSVMAFARDAVARRLMAPEEPLPIVAPIAQWDPQERLTLEAWVDRLIPTLHERVGHLLAAGRALLLLDGLDELGGERQDSDGKSYDPRSRFLEIIPDGNQVILTSRLREYEAIGTKASLQGAVLLRPLTDGQIAHYLGAVPELWEVLQTRSELRDVLRVPLLLSRFAVAFAGAREDVIRLSELEAGEFRDAVFGRFIKSRYEDERRRPQAHVPLTLEQLYTYLGQLTFTVHPYLSGGGAWTPRPVFTLEHLTERFGAEIASQLAELGSRLSLFIPEENGNYRFAHALIRDHFAFRYVVSMLQHRLRKVRVAALVVLRDLPDPRAVPLLVAALSDASGPARWNAAKALEELADPRSIEGLIDRLTDDGQPTWGDAYDQTPPVYTIAADALVKMGRAAVPSLIAALERQDRRGQVADILGRIGDARAIDPLKAARSDTDPTERATIGWDTRPVKDLIDRAIEKVLVVEASTARE